MTKHIKFQRLKSAWLYFFLVLLSSSSLYAEDEPQTEFVIGTWDNRPIVFQDEHDEISGLSIDVLKSVARKKGWKLKFKHASWAENYEALQNGSIDLLVCIAYTEKRNKIFDYPEQTLINNWGVIYQTPDHDFTSIQELQGKRVALVSKVIHSKVFIELMDRFNFPFEIIPARDFEDVLKLLDTGKADAGVINRVVSIMLADKYHVKPTSIIFNPVQVRYATLKGEHPELIKAIDDYLVTNKANRNSHYYQAINKWLRIQGNKADYTFILPVFTVAGVVLIMIAVYIYLVRREVKRRTAALAESESRFRQMADNINAVFWIVSADWKKVIYVSPAYEKIWGLSRSSLYNNAMSWLDSVHPDDVTQVQQKIINRTPRSKSDPSVLEHRIISPNGQECWISTRAYPVYDDNDKIYRITGISEDITARKLAELALARSKSEFEAIFNSISDAVIYSDLNRRVVLTNPAMTHIFGYSSEEMLGKKTDMFYVDKADFEQQGRRQFDKASDIRTATYEMRYLRKNGSTFIGETLGAKVFDTEGKTIGFIGVIRDVTQRKQVESELLQHRDHLEELVADRTTELSNLNKELEAFSYSVSHDLRAPLRAINGFSSMLAEEIKDQLSDESRDYLNRIVKASIKMEQLIDDLLQISRVSRVDLHKEDVDLSALAEEILTTLKTEDPQRDIKWQIQKGTHVKGDKTLLTVMMQNLLGNAWKYTARTPHAEINFHTTAVNGKPASYCIEDNGCGFDMKFKDKIFQPFQRLHTDEEYEGTGIGLATVNRVVHRHAGKIWAESTIDHGSRFYFKI